MRFRNPNTDAAVASSVATGATESKLRANAGWNRTFAVLTGAVLVASFLFAYNQRYTLDWDACFRAFTGFAARDVLVGVVSGDVRSRQDVVRILTRYSDYFEARPGSLVSYPPGQTAVIAVLGLFSENAWFLCAWNALFFVLLSAGMVRLCRAADLSKPAAIAAWCIICLHPTIVLTVWSLRRGLVEAAVVVWFCVLAHDFLARPSFRRFLDMTALTAGGFLYRETLALLLLPLAIVTVARFRMVRLQWPGHRLRILVTALLCGAAVLFSAAQIALAARGQLSMFSKITDNVRTPQNAPVPLGLLTIWGYYRGQFGPQEYLGRTDAELAAMHAPAVYRLARARWRLPLYAKAVYVASCVFANPLVLALLGVYVWKSARAALRRRLHAIGLPVGTSILWYAFLCPLGGIPDYVTPILPGAAVAAVLPLRSVRGVSLRRAFTALVAASTVVVACITWLGFALGRFEEYPPQYDYDTIARRLLEHEPEGVFGVAVSNYLVKNLAWSKLTVDPGNRMACYSLLGSRLPLSKIAGKRIFERYSSLLDYRRPAPGVTWFALRGPGDLRRAEEILEQSGRPRPWWDPEATVTVVSKKPLLGAFRPIELRKLRSVEEDARRPVWPDVWPPQAPTGQGRPAGDTSGGERR